MHYAQIRKIDIANGEGIRVSLFVSGCPIKCKGCFNAAFQDFHYGSVWTKNIQDEFISLGSKPYIDGFSILGGEPLAQDEELISLLDAIKTTTDKSVWLWTGFVFENLSKKQLEVLKYVDVLVDGAFIEDIKDTNLKFRGSKNQRIIDVQGSFIMNRTILYSLDLI